MGHITPQCFTLLTYLRKKIASSTTKVEDDFDVQIKGENDSNKESKSIQKGDT